ncbi:MAG: PadR family transcriptional regulator [Candidatus Thorarchaeota archaeon]
MSEEDSKKDCEHLAMPQSVPRGLLRHIIPRLLREGDKTGTEIMQEFSDRSDGEWNPSPGTIYPLLSSLEEDGIIETVKIEGRSKTYHLTEEGSKRLERSFKRRKGGVGHKTRLGPKLWEQFLDPSERVRFHIHGMAFAIDSLESVAESLKTKDRQLLQRHLEEMNVKLSSIIDTLKSGGK